MFWNYSFLSDYQLYTGRFISIYNILQGTVRYLPDSAGIFLLFSFVPDHCNSAEADSSAAVSADKDLVDSDSGSSPPVFPASPEIFSGTEGLPEELISKAEMAPSHTGSAHSDTAYHRELQR